MKRQAARSSNASKGRLTTISLPLRIKSILVPLDFSPPSKKALGYALAFARQFKAKLTLLHVVEPVATTDFTASFPLAMANDNLMAAAKEQLESVAKAARIPHGMLEKVLVRFGRSFHEIADAARTLKVDLIIISTHGYTGLKHVLLGSTTERVVRHASCPVLVVRRQGIIAARKKNARVKLRKILVPLDFSDYSRNTLGYANALARRFGSELTLLHVVHPTYYFTSSDYVGVDYGMLVDDMKQMSSKQMKDLVKARQFTGLKVRGLVRMGHPVTEIVATAKQFAGDLLIISTHGRTGLKRVWLGSIAENVVRLATCSVLVVRQR